jgi:UDP-N-acetylglucosamine--N-acetylmuramyl-(pentapeptide) pyrophosphoryl-undecaprenol N-acetylglucosamine transferase
MNRTLLVMAGGTGGHVYPALAVAELLRGEGWRVVWLATRQGLEARLAPAHGFEVVWLRMAGLRRSGALRLVGMPFLLLVAFVQSLAVLFRVRPDVALGMGGYASFPGGMMSVLLMKPLVIQEQNACAGLANRILVCLADRVLVGFPDAFTVGKPLLCRKVDAQWSGNPVRTEIAALGDPTARYAARAGRLHLLVVGGSLGASVLNETLPRALALLDAEARPEVIHQSGRQHLEVLRENYRAAGVEADCRDFIDDMAEVYGWADLVVCRAGAITIAELTVAAVASVLIPYPYAVDDHQTLNARFLSDAGAAWLLPQADLSAEKLAELLRECRRERLAEMAEKARALARPEAAETVATACRELAK